MRLSEERVSHIVHLMFDAVWKDDLIDFVDENQALREAKGVFTRHLKIEDFSDDFAREKIRSLSRDVPEGSREWDILYRQYVEEAMEKGRF